MHFKISESFLFGIDIFKIKRPKSYEKLEFRGRMFFVAAPLPPNLKIVPEPLARQQGRTQDFLRERAPRPGPNATYPQNAFLLGFQPLDFGENRRKG